ncbi:MAG: penicillin-binding protein 2 [Proteobacteria bacterium]|nr:penicillin-binding protein 2 [Pseudomonadota bacterium]
MLREEKRRTFLLPDQITAPPSRSGASSVEASRNRVITVAAGFALAFAILCGRLIDLTLFEPGSEPRHSVASGPITYERADIVDRRGVLLAANLRTASAYADPQLVIDPGAAADRLAGAIAGLDRDDVLQKLTSPRRFVWIKRGLSPSDQYAIHSLGIPGVAFQIEQRRVYPHGGLASHVLGFTGIDNRGLAGIEKSFDDRLSAASRRQAKPLALSIDHRVQFILEQEITAAHDRFKSKGAAGIVTDVVTGEVLALVSLPNFDPNDASVAPDDALFNRATLGTYEMGSTFKAFTVAMALDAGVADLKSRYDASQPLRVARFTIRDFHAKNRWLSVREVFVHSSNIGAAKIALDVGGKRQQAYLRKFGMLNPEPIELPEVGTPILPKRWRDITTMTVAFGHGLAVSPIQLAGGIGALVNGGVRVPMTLLKRDPDADIPGHRVVSPSVSRQMRKLLRSVVADGTGNQAEVAGYAVGGKTGSAEKSGKRGYRQKALISSFVGAFPIEAPRYLVLVMLDEPTGDKKTFGYATGGWTAAPAVGQIVERIAPMLGVAPQLPGGPGSAAIPVGALVQRGKSVAH